MTSVAKIIDKFYNSNWGKKIANPAATAATAVTIATVSNVSKDTVNCAYYTIQSLNNDRIPENKRKFVAALDLSNGLMNVATQLLSTFVLTKALNALFTDHVAKSKSFTAKEEVIKEKYKALSEDLKKTITEADFIERYKNHIKKRRDLAKIGFSVLVANFAMQILLKRIVTPLCATPMASVFKKKFEQREEKKNGQVQKDNKVVANA